MRWVEATQDNLVRQEQWLLYISYLITGALSSPEEMSGCAAGESGTGIGVGELECSQPHVRGIRNQLCGCGLLRELWNPHPGQAEDIWNALEQPD